MPSISGTALERLEAHLATLLDEDTLRRRGGRPIPPSVLALEPCDDLRDEPGQHRLHIAREPIPDRSAGGIIIPNVVKDNYPMTVGWVIAASASANGGAPEALLGVKAIFGKYSGGSILFAEHESDLYFGPFLSIREGELWALCPDDLNLTSTNKEI